MIKIMKNFGLEHSSCRFGEEPYLFIDRFYYPITMGFESDLAQLNDYALVCIESTSKKLNSIKTEHEKLTCGLREETRFDDQSADEVWDMFGRSCEIHMETEEELHGWQRSLYLHVKAMTLLLLAAFAEKAIKETIVFVGGKVECVVKMRKESETDSMLRYLKENFYKNLQEPIESRRARNRCRVLRNDFAHGKWDSVEKTIGNLSLRSAFSATANLLDSLGEVVKNTYGKQ